MNNIFKIVRQLKKAGVYFEIASHRDEYLMISASVPGERWEIEVAINGGVEFEIFSSNGTIYDKDYLDKKIKDFAG